MDCYRKITPDLPFPIAYVNPFSRLREKGVIALYVMLMFSCVLAATLPVWSAGENSIAVIYPDIGEPYRDIFEEIIKGVEDKIGNQVVSFPVNESTDIAKLKTSLQQQKIKVVIALGRQGMKTAAIVDNGIDVVVGGVLTVPDNEARQQPVITLSPDPALLFARMKTLMPTTKRIFVVYDPNYNGWLIKLAKDAANAQGLKLVVYQAQDLRSAVRFYQQIFSEADSDSDALWLPQDPTTVEDSSILPLVLQQSWNRDIAVFSSNFGHVRRGVLFSLYPDNESLGGSLANLASDFLNSGDGTSNRGMMALHDVHGAVNLRTAKHLGIDSMQLKSFSMKIPEQ
jgi:putative ABC transport system substrate-binding protein